MRPSTLKKWKRDALETMHDLRNSTIKEGVLARRDAKRVLFLVDQVLSVTEYRGFIKEKSGKSA